MKKLRSILSVLVIIAVLFTSTISAFAANNKVQDWRKSVVFIAHSLKFTAKNYDLSFSTYATGTGFAVGIPGKPVQYIATANHVTDPDVDSGVYQVVLDQNGNICSFDLSSEKYPQQGETEDGYIVVIDYFSAQTVSLDAYYSVSTNDKVSISVVQKNYYHDVSLCKIASDPTNKIDAMPLRSYRDVEAGEKIIAIGYPSTSNYYNTDIKLDYSDSTVTTGIISKIQLTSGIFDSPTQFYTYLVDAQIAKGNSGGPLFDEKGNILGICSFGHTDLNQAVSADYFIVIDEIMSLMGNESVPYKEAGSTNILLIALIAAAVILVAVLIILLAMHNKNKQPVPAAASQDFDETVEGNDGVVGMDEIGETVPERSSSKVYLLGVSGYFAGKKFSIEDRVVIGRDASRCNVVFPQDQPGVSGIHCEIVRNGDSLIIKDCNSTYGTYFSDGNKITPNLPVVLRNGAQFWVGDKENAFEVKY